MGLMQKPVAILLPFWSIWTVAPLAMAATSTRDSSSPQSKVGKATVKRTWYKLNVFIICLVPAVWIEMVFRSTVTVDPPRTFIA
jgi:hypothetical protein